MSLSERLKSIRGTRSQVEFASLMGVSAQAISQWENGKTEPSRENLEKLCEQENLNLDWLITGKISQADENIAERLKLARERQGFKSARQASDAMNIPYGTYAGHENGSRGIKNQEIIKYATFFHVSAAWLQFGAEEGDLSQEKTVTTYMEPITTRIEAPLGARDLPVFAAVEGGDGDLVVSTEPVDLVPRPWYMGEVKEGYAVIVTGESMIPAYDPGDMAIVNPKLPHMRGKVHIFTCESENSHFKASIKVLVRATETEWIVEQHNPPKTYSMPRSVWTHARRVVGKYNG
jgi:phage repressor protein C with HTH and peptisase S24 domain